MRSFAEFQKAASDVLAVSIDAVSAILAEKVSAAEEAARVKAEQEAAATAHAAEVAEFNRQKAIADEQRRQELAKDKAEQEARRSHPPSAQGRRRAHRRGTGGPGRGAREVRG